MGRRYRRQRNVLYTGLLVSVLTSAAMLGGAPAVSAAASAPGSSSGTESPAAVVAGPPPVSAEVQRDIDSNHLSVQDAISRYWTPERMRTAVPDDPLEKGSPPAPVPPPPSGPPHKQPPAAPTVGTNGIARGLAGSATAGAAPDVSASYTVGKVFYYDPNGVNRVCSGAAVNSNSKRLVSTAGHCVHHGPGGGFLQNWAFVPFYNFGNRPYGTWTPAWLVTFNGWASSGIREYDVGFVKTWDLDGIHLVNRVGGMGIEADANPFFAVTMLGYPHDPPYTGDWQYYCTNVTNTWSYSPSGGRLYIDHCPLSGGTSGGPWLDKYDNSTGLGYINGTSSTVNRDAGIWTSPYFDDDDWNLYNYTDSL
jgi:V8-like Glu-specific endopeptidase